MLDKRVILRSTIDLRGGFDPLKGRRPDGSCPAPLAAAITAPSGGSLGAGAAARTDRPGGPGLMQIKERDR